MGNTESAVVQKRLAHFRPEDQSLLEGTFDKLQGAKTSTEKAITLEMLQASMGCVVSDSMVKRVYRCMCSIDGGLAASTSSGMSVSSAASGVSREQLLIFLADILRGTAEKRAPLVMALSQDGAGPSVHVTCQQVAEFVQDLISAVVQVLVHRGRLQGWEPGRMGDTSLGVKLLAEQMCSELRPSDQGCWDVSCLEDWIFRVPQVSLYLETLVSEGVNISLSCRSAVTLLPACTDTPWNELRCLLDPPTVMFLTTLLPDGFRSPWRLMFSTQVHGESFSRMTAGLVHHGPTVLVVKDTKGHVFGGFASHAWEVKPQFQGDSRCFLFTVFPRLRVYTPTGYNEHFMYLNHGQQTMPNGLGMGGQLDYFGLWLDSDFGHGHSRAQPKCTTYGSPQLSGDEEFILDSVEVWAVGKPPEPEESCFLIISLEEPNSNKSILDRDLEIQAMMKIRGKPLHSQGLREPDQEPE
ncbi:MTOR-associated protein MEAK7 [Thalassophryne amazonica]|uniref:MTOR-associated protein MEAK7 n=1 Tax=Thalassophryne amazonica TaxID=390379 RepID=UPI0014713CC1|nr:MTOR-associated protein MEAK7 [Thalassophryne amazonica]